MPKSVLSGDSIGKSLLQGRRHFMSQGNPLGLAYTLFGNEAISFDPPPLPKATNATPTSE
ncbi:MAG: hypothetical protein QGF59_14010 [Pirellulaceae bacterium]|nr:hypothetical protein [Pirellulaceae bacterium]